MGLKLILLGLNTALLIWIIAIGIILSKDKENYNDKRNKKLQMQVYIILMLNAILAPMYTLL